MESIRSTLFATYNSCPKKAKYMQEIRLDNKHFGVGTAVHDVLAVVPDMLMHGDTGWDKMLLEKLGDLNECSPDMIEKAVNTLSAGVKSLQTAFDEGYDIQTEISLERVLPCGIKVTGHADRIDQKPDVFRIIDYKTGSWVPSKQDMLGDFQLLTYSFLTQDMASIKQTIEICLFSLGRDVMQTISVPMEVECVIEDILDERAIRMAGDTVCAANPSSRCQYCEYAYLCSFWQNMQVQLDIPVDINEKVERLERMMSLSAGLDGIVSQLKESVEDYMVANDLTEIEIHNKKAKMSQTVSNRGGKISVSKPFVRLPKVDE